MDTNAIASAAGSQALAGVQTTITKKAAELPAESVAILMAAAAQTQAAHNPPNLGNIIDLQA